MAEERGPAVAVLLRGDRQPKSEKAAGKEKVEPGQALPDTKFGKPNRGGRGRGGAVGAAAATPRRRRPATATTPAAANKTLPQTLHALASQPDGADVRALGAAVQKWRGEGGGIDALYPPAGHTMLMAAAAAGAAAAAKLLVEAGASANARSTGARPGCSPLLLAAEGGHAALVSLLLGAGARVDPPPLGATAHLGRKGDDSAPALQAAGAAGHLGCIRLLLKAKASAELPHPHSGLTALQAAQQNGHVSAALLLRSADVLAADAAAHPENGDAAAPAAADAAAEYVAEPEEILVAEPDDPTLGAPAAAQLPRSRPSTKRRAPRNDSPDTPGRRSRR